MGTSISGGQPSLPCYPCPHKASCCAYGTSVAADERAAIDAEFGPGLIYATRWGELRTRVKNKRCVFLRNGDCVLHGKAYYPATCRGFPWTNGETGTRYEYDVTICGEFDARPELVEIQRALPPALPP